VNRVDEMGRSQAFSIVVLYHEGMFAYSQSATSQGFILALLLSSHLVHVTTQGVAKEDIERMGFCSELLTSIQVM
jgi:hypothetical protein